MSKGVFEKQVRDRQTNVLGFCLQLIHNLILYCYSIVRHYKTHKICQSCNIILSKGNMNCCHSPNIIPLTDHVQPKSLMYVYLPILVPTDTPFISFDSPQFNEWVATLTNDLFEFFKDDPWPVTYEQYSIFFDIFMETQNIKTSSLAETNKLKLEVFNKIKQCGITVAQQQ